MGSKVYTGYRLLESTVLDIELAFIHSHSNSIPNRKVSHGSDGKEKHYMAGYEKN